MDELLNKYLGGEIEYDDFNKGVDTLSEDDKKKLSERLSIPEVKQELAKKSKEELEKISALRKERKRLETPPEAPPTEDKKDYAENLRKENLETAFDSFFKEFGVPAEEREHYREVFKQNDDGSVGVDKIGKTLRKIYATEHSDELLATRERFEAMRAGAEDFNADMGGAPGGSGPGGSGGEQYDPAVLDYVREARKKGITISPAAAKSVLERGFIRTLG